MDEMALTLKSPLTDEQWDMLNDFDFERTNRIWFHTKRGKVVEFAKVKPILTNADRIRAMTDEEMASFLYHSWDNASWCNGGCDGEWNCEPCWLDWLKQEVDDG